MKKVDNQKNNLRFQTKLFVFHYFRKFLWGDILGASPTQVFKDNS